MTLEKKCLNCKDTYKVTEFGYRPTGKYGVRGTCRKCEVRISRKKAADKNDKISASGIRSFIFDNPGGRKHKEPIPIRSCTYCREYMGERKVCISCNRVYKNI